MIKKIFILSILFFPIKNFAQNNSPVFYSGKLPDKTGFFKPSFDTVTAKIIYYTKETTDTIVEKINAGNGGLTITTDSLFFVCDVPQRLNADSVVVMPYFNIEKGMQIKGGEGDAIIIQGSAQANKLIQTRINTQPSGATVYFIPEYLWIRKPKEYWLSLPDEVRERPLAEGATPVTTNLQQYVYMVIFAFDNMVQCMEYKAQPGHQTINYQFPKK